MYLNSLGYLMVLSHGRECAVRGGAAPCASCELAAARPVFAEYARIAAAQAESGELYDKPSAEMTPAEAALMGPTRYEPDLRCATYTYIMELYSTIATSCGAFDSLAEFAGSFHSEVSWPDCGDARRGELAAAVALTTGALDTPAPATADEWCSVAGASDGAKKGKKAKKEAKKIKSKAKKVCRGFGSGLRACVLRACVLTYVCDRAQGGASPPSPTCQESQKEKGQGEEEGEYLRRRRTQQEAMQESDGVYDAVLLSPHGRVATRDGLVQHADLCSACTQTQVTSNPRARLARPRWAPPPPSGCT